MLTFFFLCLVVLALANATPTPCEVDIGKALGALDQAFGLIKKAVVDCAAGGDSAACAADISNVVTQVADAAEYINQAVTDCGGTGSACAADLTDLVAQLAAVSADVAQAVEYCDGAHTIKCTLAITHTVQALGASIVDITKAVTDCAPSLMQHAFLQTPCEVDIEKAAAALGQAGMQIAKAVTDCGSGGDPTACAADISNVVAQVADAAGYINQAVTDCGGSGSACAADLTDLVAQLARMSSDIAQAVGFCEGGHEVKCTLAIEHAVQDLFAAGKDIKQAVTDCASGLTQDSNATQN